MKGLQTTQEGRESGKARRYTRHAAERYRERCVPTVPLGHAGVSALLDEARAITVPARHAHNLTHGDLRIGRVARKQVTFRATAGRVFVVKGRVMVTCWSVPLETTAALLVWAMLGHWIEEEG